MAVKKIGILTGGGDCPGLNPTIKGVVTRAADHGIECVGLLNGWKSLVGDAPIYRSLTVDDVRPIIQKGGTMLHTSRTNAYSPKTPEALPNLLANVEKLGLDALVAIGGDDTLSVASRLTKGERLQKPCGRKQVTRMLKEERLKEANDCISPQYLSSSSMNTTLIRCSIIGQIRLLSVWINDGWYMREGAGVRWC